MDFSNFFNKEQVLSDYRIANLSRQASLLGRREVLSGKGKFGIFGDGKEVAQLAMARVFKDGDWRSGYYRDQTFMLAAGLMKVEEVFAQIYGDTDAGFNPMNAGRLMNNHFCHPQPRQQRALEKPYRTEKFICRYFANRWPNATPVRACAYI